MHVVFSRRAHVVEQLRFPPFVLALSLLLSLLGVVLPGCGSDPSAPVAEGDDLRVMTWNLYVGAGLDRLRSITTPSQVPPAVAALWIDVQRSQPQQRLQRVAQDIARWRPHLVGLQEVALFRSQSPGDSYLGGGVAARDVALDTLDLLLRALRANGMVYRVVAITPTTDVEVPMSRAGGGLDDLRLTDHEVILARDDVVVGEVQEQVFQNNAVQGSAGVGTITLVRGWTSVVATWRGAPLRFLSTHLQTEDVPAIQELQAAELLDSLATETRPLILVGDLNSRADDSTTRTHRLFLDAGFTDVWDTARPLDAGATCCQEADLSNPDSALFQRIDYVLVRGAAVDTAAWNVRVLDGERSTVQFGPRWASDHAGLAANGVPVSLVAFSR